jgi:hypothetical protein
MAFVKTLHLRPATTGRQLPARMETEVTRIHTTTVEFGAAGKARVCAHALVDGESRLCTLLSTTIR